MNTSTVDILNRGMECLTETMGVVDVEFFISLIIRDCVAGQPKHQ